MKKPKLPKPEKPKLPRKPRAKVRGPRKKSKRFKTGTYTSVKMGKEMVHRSSWELEFMKFLDADPLVKTFQSEGLIIPYLKSAKSKVSKYFPDFIVEYTDGRTVMYEIKPERFMDRRINLKKWEQAILYCNRKGWTFEVLNEGDLKGMGLLKGDADSE